MRGQLIHLDIDEFKITLMSFIIFMTIFSRLNRFTHRRTTKDICSHRSNPGYLAEYRSLGKTAFASLLLLESFQQKENILHSTIIRIGNKAMLSLGWKNSCQSESLWHSLSSDMLSAMIQAHVISLSEKHSLFCDVSPSGTLIPVNCRS